MVTIIESQTFIAWMQSLRDRAAQIRIATRIRRLQLGNPGDIKNLGGGLSEMRINCGPGYRVYLTQRGDTLIVLLCGGDKSTQSADIAKARIIALENYDVR